MARKKGKIVKKVRAGLIKPEEGRKLIETHYNNAVPAFSANWAKITPTKGDEWASAMGSLLEITVDPAYSKRYTDRVKEVGVNFEKFVTGKGGLIPARMTEKLKKAVAG